MKIILILTSLLVAITCQNLSSPAEPTRKKFYCPKRFSRIGRRCYFFSKNAETWQNAYYKCRDRKSNIAIIKSANQDNRVKRILNRPSHAVQERWIGGIYNWKQMKWLWAVSGQPITYQGFSTKNFTENQKWHCIIMDPSLNYKWNTRPCFEKKSYICHTKAKTLTDNYYDNHPDSRINEVLHSTIEYRDAPADLKLKNGTRTRSGQRRRKNNRKKINDATILLLRPQPQVSNTKEKRHFKNDTSKTLHNISIKYENYKEVSAANTHYYPNPIVEEYSLMANH